MSGPLFYDLVLETTIVTGTGTMTVLGPLTGFRSFSVVGNGNLCPYEIFAVDANGVRTGDWEIGIGIYNTSTITRDLVLDSTNSGSLVNFAAGTKRVALVNPSKNINNSPVKPQGRLTLSSGNPVMFANVTGATTVYYTPAEGVLAPIRYGATWFNRIFSELSQATTDSTKSPAACGTYRNYDMFLWDDAGTLRCTRGPEWTQAQTFTVTIASPGVFTCNGHGFYDGMPVVFSTTGALPTGLTAGTTYFLIATGLTANAFEVATAPGGTAINTSGSQSGTHTVTQNTTVRGTGAGTTELDTTTFPYTNKNAITNGPAANMGTFVGTIRTNGSSQIDVIFGGVGVAGGESTVIGIWNGFNRSRVTLTNIDSTGSWNYSTNTARMKNAGATANGYNNRIQQVVGLQGQHWSARHLSAPFNNNANIEMDIFVGLNSSNSNTLTGGSRAVSKGPIGYFATVTAAYGGVAPLGFNYVAPLENGGGTATTTWSGPLDFFYLDTEY